jgi:hypothetical protein
MEGERDFMRAHGKKQEGQRNVLPPQIFNGEKYCGVRALKSFFFVTCDARRVVVTMKDVGSSPGGAAFDFDSYVGKMMENCRNTLTISAYIEIPRKL